MFRTPLICMLLLLLGSSLFAQSSEKALMATQRYLYNAADSVWDALRQNRYFYNEYGRDTAMYDDVWKAEKEDWDLEFKHTRAYNEQQLLKERIRWKYDPDSLIWIPDGKLVFQYNAANKLYILTRTLWNQTTEEWDLSYEDTYQYFSEQNQRDVIRRVWIAGEERWKLYSSDVAKYNEDDKLETIATRFWVDSLGTWDFRYLKRHYYNEEGQIELFQSNIWSEERQEWRHSFQQRYDYFSNGSLAQTIVQSWDEDINEWEYLNRQKYSYDSLDYRKSVLYQIWDAPTNNWRNHTRTDYLWEEKSFFIVNTSVDNLVEDISCILPNPYEGGNPITCENISPSSVWQLYDLMGRLVWQKEVNNKVFVLPEQLQTGLYILQGMNAGRVIYQQKLSVVGK